jgi:ankyrin repeat protein
MLERLLNFGADINAQNNDGNTALWMALMQQNKHSTHFLVLSGADANISNKMGLTAKAYMERLQSKILK